MPTLVILIVLCFFLMQVAPGGPFTSERPLPPQVLANIEARYGLDQPLWKQMWELPGRHRHPVRLRAVFRLQGPGRE